MSVIIAYFIDRFLGEPPNRIHPVAWVGSMIHLFRTRALSLPPRAAFVAGMLFWMAAVSGIAAITAFLSYWCSLLVWPFSVLITAFLLKPLFAVRMLVHETVAVEDALMRSSEEGRRRLSHIVSRNTRRLSKTGVREAALESLSENFSDSVVAPLFWFALLGLPGVAIYRFANTADAMLGYRDEREWLGKWAARADDVLNYIPARISAILLWLMFRCRFPFHSLIREARKTPSPNGGYPMSAFAFGNGIRLRKQGVYDLNPRGNEATHADVMRGVSIIETSARIVCVFAAIVSCVVRHV